MLHDVLGILSKHGYSFNDVTIENCKDLSNANGFSFSSFEIKRGLVYRIYCINEHDKNNVYNKIADNKDAFKEYLEEYTHISYCSENHLNSLQIYIHQVKQTISLKSFLLNNSDDNYQLQSIYACFVSFYNVISQHHISLVEPNPETIALNTERKITIDNLDYFRITEISGNNLEFKVDYSLYLNSIWLLTFLRVANDKPELLKDKIFLEMENGMLDGFLTEQVVPYLKNKEYRLLFSLITCIQQNKAVEIEIDSSNSFNTQFTADEWQNAKLVANGLYSPDGTRFYGVRVQECTPRYSFQRFHIVPNSIKLEGDKLSIICNHAFRECNYLEDVSIPEGVGTIGEDAFFGVKHIERINFPESLKAICGNPFVGVIVDELNNLSPYFIATRYALYSKGLHRLISFYGDTEEFLVPNQTKIIGEQAFAYNKSIIEVSIGESVIEIRDKAFYLCPKLKKVTLPKSLKRIGERAFFQLDIKHDYDLDDNQESFEPSLEELRIPSNVEYIGRAAFNGIRNIENDSPYYKIDKDALLSNDGTNLIYYFGKSKKYRIPSGVETVWSDSFMGNQYIEEITIPRSVRTIESNAFKACSQLRSVVFNSDYLFLGDSAFFECKKLSSVKMPKRMGNLSGRTFWGCQSLTEIKIPEGVEIIGNASFWYCYSLKKIVLPSSIKTIEDDAFNHCDYLSELHLPEGLKKISSNAFEHCESLSKIILPQSLEFIGNFAFSFCDLQECVITNEKTIFGKDVFSSNDDVILIIPPKADPKNYIKIIPVGVRDHTETSDGPLPFLGPQTENIVPYIDNKSLDELLSPPEHHYSYYEKPAYLDKNGGVYTDGMQRLIVIEKEEINNKKKYIVSPRTKYICNNVFGGRYSFVPFEMIVLPKTLVAIGNYCFAHSRIKEINLPDSLEYIGDYAFMDCIGLSSIVIPKSVNHIGVNPFYNTDKYVTFHLNEVISNSPHFIVESDCLLSKDREDLISCFEKRKIDFLMPNGVKHICMYSFAMTGVNSIKVPHSVDTIEEGAFENGLFTAISIPSQVKYLGQKAFSHCSALQTIDISNTQISVIENELFDECESIESISLPNNTTSVGNYAFRGCKKLLSINIPESVDKIGINPFVKSGVSEIILNNSVYKLIDGILYGCNGKEIVSVLTTANKTLIVPEGVETICQEAFAGNSIIEEVVCPTTLRIIDKKAFAGCSSLQKVNLEDSSVKELAELVFDGCSQLETVILPKHLSKIDDYAFQKCEKLISITLPRGIRSIKDKAFNGSGLKSIYLSYGLDTKLLPWSFKSKGKQLSAEESGLYQDEYGVVFSKDKTILIDAPYELESYIIPTGTKEIMSGAFIHAGKLMRLSIPNSVVKLGNEVFNCPFKELILPDSVTEIGDNLISWCHLKEFTIPSSVTTIKGNPFGMMPCYKGKSCKVVNKSDSFTLINGVLYSKDLRLLICCTDLTRQLIDIIDTVTVINDSAFFGSEAKSIIIPPSVRRIGRRSFYNTQVSELYIPGTIEVIEGRSFENCHANLIVLSEGIRIIESYAFSGCNVIQEITIPNSVEKVDKYAFAGCYRLHTVRINHSHAEIDPDAFKSENIKRVIVPIGSISWYNRILPELSNRLEEANDSEDLNKT